MKAYIYQAALLCETCGLEVRSTLKLEHPHSTPLHPEDESSYDSDQYPKGPYADGGGEADCPNHCDICHVFLENPLTSDGEAYVRAAMNAYPLTPGNRFTFRIWREFYSYLFAEVSE